MMGICESKVYCFVKKLIIIIIIIVYYYINILYNTIQIQYIEY